MNPHSLAQRALRHPSFVLGSVLLCLVACAALLSLVWTPYALTDIEMARKLMPPSGSHWLGTDALGRDVVSLLLAGARSSILVGVVAVGIGLSIGVALGLLAAAYKGWLEEALMRLTDFSFAFPAILVAILITAVLGPGMVNAILAIGLFNIPVFARITRGSAQATMCWRHAPAARDAGASPGTMSCPTLPLC
jgi:peptide/nickel transport system permease protein